MNKKEKNYVILDCEQTVELGIEYPRSGPGYTMELKVKGMPWAPQRFTVPEQYPTNLKANVGMAVEAFIRNIEFQANQQMAPVEDELTADGWIDA